MSVTSVTKRVLIADPSDKPRQALAETLLRKHDILLLDLSVQILPAERLIQILRSNPNTKSVPVFFLSDREQSVSGFRQGLDEFIRKPFHEEEIFLPDLWQMLAMNRKNGILQVDAERVSGSVYIERGEIIYAVTRNIIGEKALFRLIPLKEGKFRFLPGKVGVRRTIFTPSQQAILEGMRHHDELRKLGIDLPHPDDAVAVVPESGELPAAGGVIREILLLAEFCATVEEMVDNCGFPDLVVYEALIALRNRGVLRFGDFNARTRKSDFLPPA